MLLSMLCLWPKNKYNQLMMMQMIGQTIFAVCKLASSCVTCAKKCTFLKLSQEET